MLSVFLSTSEAFADGISYVAVPHYATGSLYLLVTLFVLSVITFSVSIFRAERVPNVFRKYVPLALFLVFLVCASLLDKKRFAPMQVADSATADLPIFKFVLPFFYKSLPTAAVALWITALVDSLNMIHFFLGLCSTLLIETLILYFGLGKEYDGRSKVLIGCLLSLATFPIVNLLIPIWLNPETMLFAYCWISETFAFLAECLLFVFIFSKKRSTKSQLAVNCAIIFLANVASFTYGYFFL